MITSRGEKYSVDASETGAYRGRKRNRKGNLSCWGRLPLLEEGAEKRVSAEKLISRINFSQGNSRGKSSKLQGVRKKKEK